MAVSAAPAPYAVASLDPALRRHAASVVRRHDAVLTFERFDSYTYSVTRVVTVLTPAGADEAHLVVGTSSLHKITELSARLYDADGTPGRRLRGSSDWRDVSATAAGTFLDDTRARVADARQPTTPYTVELTYEIRSTNPLFLPDWQPQQAWNQSVESATFALRHPDDVRVRHREWQLPAGAARPDTVTGGLPTQRWAVRRLPALRLVPQAPPLSEQAPGVWCAPVEFEVQGYAGRQTTWDELGRWYDKLNADRDKLPPALVAEMTALRDSVADPRRRARRVYERVQRTTRYVSIQLGLGGWQTLPAADVTRTGYGDCKALTTYCRALLAAAGLPSFPALVGAGVSAPDLHPEWVAPQFNHVVLCVPLARTRTAPADTVWLECTSGTQPFGALGAFTAGRHALLVLPLGGRLVRTPTLDAANTARVRRLTLHLAPTGNATATVHTRRTGALGDAYAALAAQPPTDQRRTVTEALNATTSLSIKSLQLTTAPPTTAGAVVDETLDLSLPTVAARAGTRLRLPLNVLSRWEAPRADSARRAPLWLTESITYLDSVTVRLPPGARAEDVPPPLTLTTPFGSLRVATTVAPDGTALLYRRELRTTAGRFPASEWPAYVAFTEQIARADRQQATLLVEATH